MGVRTAVDRPTNAMTVVDGRLCSSWYGRNGEIGVGAKMEGNECPNVVD